MYDFEFVAVIYVSRGPVGTADDDIIQFDRHSLTWERKKLEKLVYFDRFGNFSSFAVKEYLDSRHAKIFRFAESKFKFEILDLKFCGHRSARRDYASQLDLFAFGDGADEKGCASGLEMGKLEVDVCKAVVVGLGVEYDRAKARAQHFDHDLGISDDAAGSSAAEHNIDRSAVASRKLGVAQQFQAEFFIGRSFNA